MKQGIIIVIIIGGLIVCCKDKENQNTDLIEQKALNIFADSILYKTFYFNVDSGYVSLYPNNYKESWQEEGIFWGWTAASDGLIRSVSQPYYNKETILNTRDIDSSFRDTALELIRCYDSLTSINHDVLKLKLPDPIKSMTYTKFDSQTIPNLVFVSVGYHLAYEEGYFVQISALTKDLINEPIFGDSLERYDFYFWFDKNKELTKWE